MRIFSVFHYARKLRRYRAVAMLMAQKRRRTVELAQIFNRKHREAQKEVARLLQELDAEREAAERDPLTHLLNRRGFDRRLVELRSYIGRSQNPTKTLSTLLIFDLNNVKRINSERGHAYMDT